MGSIGKGGELELELVNGGSVLELGLAIAQRTSGEGEEGSGRAAAEGRGGNAGHAERARRSAVPWPIWPW